MPQINSPELPRYSDPARHFKDVEPWVNTWRCRFVPNGLLQRLDCASDPGLVRLLHLQSLISDEVEAQPSASAARAGN